MVKIQHNLGIALIPLFVILGICHQSENTKLRLVSMVFRHGDRTLDTKHESYPNDPYKNYNFYPNNNGQLTNNGKKRSYELGLILRNRYNNFLGKLYYQPNVYAYSTTYVRTKMTLQLVLAALYPPIGIQRWDPLLSWQPTDFMFGKNILLMPHLCPVYSQLYYDTLQNNLIKKKITEFDDLMKKVSVYSGKNITKIYDLMLIYSTLSIESDARLHLPEWTQNIFPNGKLLDATILQYDLFNYGTLKKYNGGVLLRRIINDMNEVINGTLKDRKINLFSAHDINVAAMLQVLNIFDYRVPRYTSSVIIELHEKDHEFFIKVVHYLGNLQIIEKRIFGCEILCPYKKFIQLTSAVTATNDDLNCPLGDSFVF